MLVQIGQHDHMLTVEGVGTFTYIYIYIYIYIKVQKSNTFYNHHTGRERLIRSHSSARFCFELSGNSN